MNINNKINFCAKIHKIQNHKENNTQFSNSRELEMIPTYLQLEEIEGKDRFNQKEIETITKAFKYYDTKLSITDLLKELLSIGKNRGNLLSTNEIVSFLEATSGLKQLEQKNIIKFAKIAKENEQDKVTIETIKEAFPYHKFRNYMLNSELNKEIAQREKNWLSEENIKKRYEIMIENEYRISSNIYLQKALHTNSIKPINFINKENRIFVEALSKCLDQNATYNVVKTLGVTPSITASIKFLAEIWQLSDKNKAVIIDLNRGFYPSEIKQISNYFKENKNNKDLIKKLKYHLCHIEINYNDGMPMQQNLQRERTRFLKEFDLEDKIILKPLVRIAKEDVYPTNLLQGRGKRITDGNFEAGKKR